MALSSAQRRKGMVRMPWNHRITWRVIAGIVFALSAIYFIAEHHNYAICNSGFGQFAQAISQKAATECDNINTWHYVSLVFVIVSAGVFAATFLHRNKPTKRFATDRDVEAKVKWLNERP